MVSLINATLQLRIDATKEDFQKENVWKRILIECLRLLNDAKGTFISILTADNQWEINRKE